MSATGELAAQIAKAVSTAPEHARPALLAALAELLRQDRPADPKRHSISFSQAARK